MYVHVYVYVCYFSVPSPPALTACTAGYWFYWTSTKICLFIVCVCVYCVGVGVRAIFLPVASRSNRVTPIN